KPERPAVRLVPVGSKVAHRWLDAEVTEVSAPTSGYAAPGDTRNVPSLPMCQSVHRSTFQRASIPSGGSMRMNPQVTKLVATAGLLFGIVAVATGPAAAASRHDSHTTLFVSNHRSTTWSHERHHDGCEHATFTSIGAAVAAANPYDTVIVCPGTYAEDVQVTKPLQLMGRHATINATGLANGIVITSSYVGVSGFAVTGALGEGILAQPPGAAALPFLTTAAQALQPISQIGIWNNVVNANNTGGDPVTHQCTAHGLYPGDCGGGIHLNTVSDSFVTQNDVTYNNDGILLTDDAGPNFGNYIADNYVAHNIYECGIVMPSHNSFAVSYVVNPD